MAKADNPPQQNPPPAPEVDVQGKDDPVVVRVLGESIREKQVLAAIDQIASRQQMMPGQMEPKETLYFQDAVEGLVGFVLLQNAAREQNIAADPAKVDETYQSVIKRFPSEAAFKEALTSQGLTEAALRKSIEENQISERVIDLALKDVPAPSDEAVSSFYQGNPQHFQQPEQIHAAHILLKADPNSAPEKKAEIRGKLEAIRADIAGKKTTFAAAAAKNSEDTSNAASGGDLGFFQRGRMVKPFEDAAFEAAPGSLTPVVETQFGYHLIHVLEKKAAATRSLEDSRADIVSFLSGNAKQEAFQKYMQGLQTKAAIETVMSEEEWKKRHPSQQSLPGAAPK